MFYLIKFNCQFNLTIIGLLSVCKINQKNVFCGL